mgnify:CR=1 FL=1
MKNKVTAYHLCVIAFCVVINIVGGQIALFARLPIYLDSIGTVLAAAVFGPVYGMLPSLLRRRKPFWKRSMHRKKKQTGKRSKRESL